MGCDMNNKEISFTCKRIDEEIKSLNRTQRLNKYNRSFFNMIGDYDEVSKIQDELNAYAKDINTLRFIKGVLLHRRYLIVDSSKSDMSYKIEFKKSDIYRTFRIHFRDMILKFDVRDLTNFGGRYGCMTVFNPNTYRIEYLYIEYKNKENGFKYEYNNGIKL